MDSFTFNKIAGAVLGTCLFGMGTGIIAGGIFNPGAPEKPGYALPSGEDKPASADAAPVAAAPPEEDPIKLIAAADPKRGQSDAQICAGCHNLKEGGGVLVGPPLWGVVGRPKGHIAGFDYSAGMKAKGGDWTYVDLNHFITKPSAYVEGTKMGFAGESDPKKRADIIAFLRTLATTPVPLPAASDDAPKPAPAAAPAPAPAAPTQQKTEAAPAPAAPAQLKTEAAPGPVALPKDAASLGPEPYDGADPQDADATPDAGAPAAAAPSTDTASLGPEPYDGADPQYDGTATASAALAAPATDTASLGPEPYDGADPQYDGASTDAASATSAVSTDQAALGPEPYDGADPEVLSTPPRSASVNMADYRDDAGPEPHSPVYAAKN